MSGTITATSGLIGGFTIGSTTLTGTDFTIDTSGKFISLGSDNTIFIADADTGIQLGHATFGSYHAVQPTSGHRAVACVVSNHRIATEHFHRSSGTSTYWCAPCDAGAFGHCISAGKSAGAGRCRSVTDNVEGGIPGQRLCRADDWNRAAGIVGE